MDCQTKAVGKYIRETGINLSKMARETEIPYISIYDSLVNESRDRNLRVGEFFKICEFLKKNPMDFAESNELFKRE